MAIINDEIGNIFLAPPKSILIRRYLLQALKQHDLPKVSLPNNLPS